MNQSKLQIDQPALENPPSLGKLLRALRARNGWTLREMSDQSGIPVSTLSKVEHDRLTLTYDKLVLLSRRLNIRVTDLFAEVGEEMETPVVARRSIGRIDRAIQVTTTNYDYHYLCPELRRKRMIPTVTIVKAKTIEEFGALVHHSGEEFIHVLEGSIEVHTEFYDAVVLHKGESLYIDSQMGHAYLAAEGCDEAIILAVCSSPDQAFMNWLTDIRASVENDGIAADRTNIRNLHHFATGRKVSRLGALQDADG